MIIHWDNRSCLKHSLCTRHKYWTTFQLLQYYRLQRQTLAPMQLWLLIFISHTCANSKWNKGTNTAAEMNWHTRRWYLIQANVPSLPWPRDPSRRPPLQRRPALLLRNINDFEVILSWPWKHWMMDSINTTALQGGWPGICVINDI